jgi:hypothetical protein
MMAFTNIEDPWIDYLIISRLGGCYTTPIIQFFQDEDSESRLTLSLGLQLNLRLGGYSIWSAILQSHFHIITTSRQMSWTTFQPRGSSSTIEDFSKQYTRMLKNYSKRLQDYRTITLGYNVLGGLSGIHPGYSYKEG